MPANNWTVFYLLCLVLRCTGRACVFFINQKYSYGGRVSCRYTTNKPFAAQQVDIFKGGARGVACIYFHFGFLWLGCCVSFRIA